MPGLKQTEYLLMNKDVPLLAFACRQNEFEETELKVGQWLSDLRPIGLCEAVTDAELVAYLERRKAPKHRQHIQELLRKFGCEDLEGSRHPVCLVGIKRQFQSCWPILNPLVVEMIFAGCAFWTPLS